MSKVVMEVIVGDTIEIFPEYNKGYFKASSKGVTGWIAEVWISKALPQELKTHEFKYKQDIANKQKREQEREEYRKKKEEDWKKKEAILKKNAMEKKERLIKKYGQSIANKIIVGKIWIGMTDDMARASMGQPDDINRTVTRYGTSEQWVYNRIRMYLYFEDGILTSWQE
jgi:hypothetical protein